METTRVCGECGAPLTNEAPEGLCPKCMTTGRGDFPPTRWSRVFPPGGHGDTTHARQALESLCRTYWQPIYAYVRHRGRSPQDAEDLTQEFFVHLIEKHALGKVSPSKGRFRDFLLASVRNFLANDWDKARAKKRGGDQIIVPFDTQLAEAGVGLPTAAQDTPEKIFERRWALRLLEVVLAHLRAEYEQDGKTALFEALKPSLPGGEGSVPYAEVAERLRVSEGSLRVEVHRLRRRYRELVREEIGHTVASKEEVEDEIRALFAAL